MIEATHKRVRIVWIVLAVSVLINILLAVMSVGFYQNNADHIRTLRVVNQRLRLENMLIRERIKKDSMVIGKLLTRQAGMAGQISDILESPVPDSLKNEVWKFLTE